MLIFSTSQIRKMPHIEVCGIHIYNTTTLTKTEQAVYKLVAVQVLVNVCLVDMKIIVFSVPSTL